MHVSRRRICCNATNSFHATSALRAIFFDANSIRFSSTSHPSEIPLEIEVNLPQAQSPRNPLDAESYVDPNSLRQTLNNLRNQNRAILSPEGVLEDSQASLAAALSSSSVVLNTLGQSHKKRREWIRNKVQNKVQDKVSISASPDWRRVAITGSTNDADIDSTHGPGASDEAYEGGKMARIVNKKKEAESQEVLEYEGQYVYPIKARAEASPTFPWVQHLNMDDFPLPYEQQVCIDVPVSALADFHPDSLLK